MKFEPKSEQEVSNVLKPGVYEAQVIEAEERISSSGNEMIAIQLRVYTDEAQVVLSDWLMPKIAYKLRHFCKATDQLEKYEKGSLNASDCMNQAVNVKLAVEEDIKYGAQNRVRDYVMNKPTGNGAVGEKEIKKQSTFKDEDQSTIPF